MLLSIRRLLIKELRLSRFIKTEVIFNHQAFEDISGREVRDDRLLMLEDEKPLIFGKDRNKGIKLSGFKPEIVSLDDGYSEEDLVCHKESVQDPTYSYLLTQMQYPDFPTPMGAFRSVQGRQTYEDQLTAQTKDAVEQSGKGNLQMLLNGPEFWKLLKMVKPFVRLKCQT